MTPKPLTRLRRICLALPQAVEQETWGEPTFRIRGKIFAGRQDWDEIARIVERSYRLVAPKRLVALSPRRQGNGAAVAPRRVRARRK